MFITIYIYTYINNNNNLCIYLNNSRNNSLKCNQKMLTKKL